MITQLASSNNLQPVSATDICTRCRQLVPKNAQWHADQPYCSMCALFMVAEGHLMHGSRVQGRFWDAASRARRGMRAQDLLWEEYPVVISGRRFRADFIVRMLPELKIAVEIDSFTHHSSSQALTRDHQRQRMFQGDGWVVVRFSGSEVWYDPARCVEDLITIVLHEACRSRFQFPAAA